MPNQSRTAEERMVELEAYILKALGREVALTAQVHALRDYLRKHMEHFPIPEVSPGHFDAVFQQSVALHKEELLIQLENVNPALSAYLSSLKDDQ